MATLANFIENLVHEYETEEMQTLLKYHIWTGSVTGKLKLYLMRQLSIRVWNVNRVFWAQNWRRASENVAFS